MKNIENRDNAYYKNIISSLRDGLAVIIDYKITTFNQAMEELTGVSASTALNRSVQEVFKKNLYIVDLIEKSVNRGKTYYSLEAFLKRKYSEPVNVNAVVSPYLNDEGEIKGAVLILKDIMRFKELEEQLLMSENLNSIGMLAVGMAHEIKNPLGGIRGAAQLLKDEIGDTELKEYVSVIIKEVDRLNNIIEGMLDFTRSKKLVCKSANIHELIDEVIFLVKQDKISADIDFVLSYDPSLPEIVIDRDLIYQVFVNIVKNGIESIANRGIIRISTRAFTDYKMQMEGTNGGRYMLIEFEDNGIGISKEDLKRIFTPFVTTKVTGSGLGLANSYKIIERHKGMIKVKSSKGTGTRFQVILPFSC